MSRGLGRVQRAILDLIAANPDGAWSTDELCEIIYPAPKGVERLVDERGNVTPGPSKAERVAILRAARRVKLPGTWEMRWGKNGWGDPWRLWLCDPCNLAGMKLVRRGYGPKHFEPGGLVYEEVEKARRWRDASLVERIDIKIQDAKAGAQQVMTMYQMGLGKAEAYHNWKTNYTKRVQELEAEKARLTAASEAT